MADEVLTYAVRMDAAAASAEVKEFQRAATNADAAAKRLASDVSDLSAAEVQAAQAIRDAKTSLDNQAKALGLSRSELVRMRDELSAVEQAQRQATAAAQAARQAEDVRSQSLQSTSGALAFSRQQIADLGDETAKTAAKFQSSARAINAAGGNLRSQFLDIGVGVAGGMSPLLILSQQGPQIAEALSSVDNKAGALKASLAPLAGILKTLLSLWAPLAAVVGAAGAAYVVYANQTEKAANKSEMFVNALDGIQEAANKAADALDEAKSSWEAFQGTTASLERQFAVLSGAKTEAEAAAEEQVADLEAQARPRIDALNQEANALQTEIGLRRRQIREAQEDQKNLSAGELKDSVLRIQALETELAMAKERRQQKLDAAAAAETELERAKFLAEVVVDLQDKEERRTELTKIRTREAKQETKEAEKQATAMERIAAAQRQQAAMAERQSFMDATSAVQAAAGLDLTQLRAAELELGYTLAELEQMLSATTNAADAEAIEYFIRQLITSAEQVREFGVTVGGASRSQRAAEGLTGAIGVASGGSDALVRLLSSAGPYGALASAGIGLVEGLAEGGEDNALQDIAELPLRVAKGLDQLPTALSGAITTLITEAQPAFVQALPDLFTAVITQAAPEIAKALVRSVVITITETLPTLIEKFRANLGTVLGTLVREVRNLDLRGSIGEALAKVFTVDFWREVLRNLVQAIRDFSLSDIDTPGLDAFRETAGFERSEREGIRSRVQSAREGIGARVQNITVNGVVGDGRAIRRQLQRWSLRRDGVPT